MICHSEYVAATRRLESLRDFFMARDADDLADAWIKLTQEDVFTLVLPVPPAVPDWEAVEFSFNKLFVGPQPPLTPPFASIYLDAEPYVMGASSLKARNIYRLLGRQSPLVGTFPDDHISLEIDALLAMLAALGRVQAPELVSLLDYFLQHHMLEWAPTFCEAVWSQEEAHPAIAHAARLLSHCLLKIVAASASAETIPSERVQLVAHTEEAAEESAS